MLIVLKHQPLSFHKQAVGAAMAMQAAHRQGKAWEMHDKMFANNKALARDDLDRYAEEIGLDIAKFKQDMADPAIKDEVLADQKIGNGVGATGTPASFINGRRIKGAKPYARFKQLIDAELKEADKLIEQGTPIAEIYAKRANTK